VISIEIPDDFHVEATSLLHGRDALIVRADLGLQLPYGVLSPEAPTVPETAPPHVERLAGKKTGAGADAPRIHGSVSIIRPVPSRRVTVIHIEIPDLYHVEVTNLLHGRDALVMPAALPRQTPYGVIPPLGAAVTRPTVETPPAAHPSASSMLSRGADRLVVTRWLGAQCASEAFQDFLGVRNEAQARNRVCEICGVDSRARIQGSPAALQAFQTEIYEPFRARRGAPHVENEGGRPREGPTP